MIALLALALALTLCVGALAEAEDVPGNRLGFKALALLADGTKNQFVSPLGLCCALSMAAAGAQGETQSELLSALEAGDPAQINALNDALRESGLSLANAAFVQEGTALLPSYVDALAAFEAEQFPLNDLEPVNAWAREHTNGLIDPFLTQLNPNIRLMLVNAIAMDAEWGLPFDANDTATDVFHAPGGDIQADFMRQTYEYADYGERDGMQMLKLGYRDCGLTMLLALPPEGGVSGALDALASQGLAALDYEPIDTRVWLSLPRLDVSVSNSLCGTLRTLGVREAFGDAADFSGISDRPLKIDDVLQKVRVQIDEKGTRAAALTAVFAIDGAAMVEEPRPIVPMVLNRPFIIVIYDGNTGAAAFAGVVAAPEASDISGREPEWE